MPVPGGLASGRAPAPGTVITFIIRRLIATVFLLIVVSMITFAIFFLVPRLAGQTTYQLADPVRRPQPDQRRRSVQVERQLGLDAPLYLQYGTVPARHRARRRTTTAARPTPTARRPASATPSSNQQPVWPQMVSDIPVTLSLAIGACGALAGRRGVDRRAVRAEAGARVFDRFSMGVALAGVSLPIFFTGLIALELFSYRWPIFPNVHVRPFHPEPVACGRRTWCCPGSSWPSSTRALYARLTRAGMLETMSEDYIRTARAKGLPERTVIVKHGLRAALTPIVTIFGMDLGAAARRRDHHRGDVLAARPRPVHRRGHRRTRTCRRSWASPCWPRSSSSSPTWSSTSCTPMSTRG